MKQIRVCSGNVRGSFFLGYNLVGKVVLAGVLFRQKVMDSGDLSDEIRVLRRR